MILARADGCLDCVGIFNDFGTQRGLMISPSMYREFIKPHPKKLVALAHNYGLKVFYHSCGAVDRLYDDLIDIGVDIVDPLQLAAMDRTPESLKAEFGDRITLHGGVDIQNVVPFTDSAGTTIHVRRLVETLGSGGGYIVSGTHLYQVDSPVENIKAIHESLIQQAEVTQA